MQTRVSYDKTPRERSHSHLQRQRTPIWTSPVRKTQCLRHHPDPKKLQVGIRLLAGHGLGVSLQHPYCSKLSRSDQQRNPRSRLQRRLHGEGVFFLNLSSKRWLLQRQDH